MNDGRLGNASLRALPQAVGVPAQDREATRIGIVHLGPGAFHRAHQADYVDRMLAIDPTWAISAVSLHDPGVAAALTPQDGLYTLALMDEVPRLRVLGAIRELLHAPSEPRRVLERLVDPGVRLLTLTVTEKGYCLAGDRLDMAHPEILRDLASPAAPTGAIGHVVAGLRLRRERGIAPYTVLSCDNLPDNGGRLRRAVLDFAARLDAGLADWIARAVAFPRSMVDSITPATDDALRSRVSAALAVRDAWPVQREPFAQWVVEDAFCNDRPPLDRVGVSFSDDIAGHDRAKLRLLNGPHSALAYIGSLMAVETVAGAMQAPPLAGLVERMMREDIAPTLGAVPGLDVDAYIAAILARFRNPVLQHRLSQIAWDGSQKLPVRLLGTIADALEAGRPIERLCLPVAAWMQFVRRQARAGATLVDPMAATLVAIGRACTGRPRDDVDAFFGLGAVFAPLSADPRFAGALHDAYAALADGSRDAVLTALQALSEPPRNPVRAR